MTDEEFLRALDGGLIEPAAFHHVDHVRAAYLYLRREDFAAACTSMRRVLVEIATAAGKPERYHETITLAYLRLINDRLGRASAGRAIDPS